MDGINKNINPADEVKPEDAIFVWLDILGFSKELEDDSRYTELKKVLIEFHSLFDNNPKYSAFIISDGIILHIKKEIGYEGFQKVIKEIGQKQYQFIKKHKRFIRGGISVGSKLPDNEENKKDIQKYFISNGLPRAVNLESRYVDWPVIGTNKNTISLIQKFFDITNEEEFFSFLRGLNKNGDDLYFVDFLDQFDQEYFEMLNQKIDEFRDDAEIKNKYIWLIKYFCHKYSSVSIPEDLRGYIL